VFQDAKGLGLGPGGDILYQQDGIAAADTPDLAIFPVFSTSFFNVRLAVLRYVLAADFSRCSR